VSLRIGTIPDPLISFRLVEITPVGADIRIYRMSLFFVQSQLAQMRQAVRRASEAWLLARIGRMNWQENGTAGAEKGIASIVFGSPVAVPLPTTGARRRSGVAQG
jgi:hypothetical protein